MLITTRPKRLHINENSLSLSYNNVELQVTIDDKILGVKWMKIYFGIITIKSSVKRCLLIFGYCLELVIICHTYSLISIIVTYSGKMLPT